MLKQVEIRGQRFELHTIDGGRTWASNPRSILTFKRRRQQAFVNLKKAFEFIDNEMPGFDFDPDDLCQVNPSNHLSGRF